MLRATRLLVLSLLIVACTSQDEPVAGDASTASVPTTAPAATSTSPATTDTTETGQVKVLLYSNTAGYRHTSIEAGIKALEKIAAQDGFEVGTTEDGAVLASILADFDVVVFLNTTGDVLDETQQDVMEAWVEDGGGFIGIHSSADTEYDWDWYSDLHGPYFSDHPAVQDATVVVVAEHPVTAGLPASFQLSDEWYNFQTLPPNTVTILAEVDETTYEGGTMGDSHPIVWAHEYGGGRSVYLGFGHEAANFSDHHFRALIANSISWTSGAG